DRLVQPSAAGRQLGTNPRVVVPVGLGVKLNEPHSPLDQPARDQALLPEGLRAWLVETVEPADRLGLGADVEDFGGLHLHPEGQLERFNPRGQAAVVLAVAAMATVELVDQVELPALLGGG